MIIDLAKLLLSKDLRESLQATVGALTRTPAWKEDLIVVSETFKQDQWSLADVFVGFTTTTLQKKNWPIARAGVAEFVATELIRNAFSHSGKQTGDLSVRVDARLTSQWAEFCVADNGAGFDLATVLQSQLAEPRGLTFVKRSASALMQPRRTTIVARVDCVASSQSSVDDGDVLVVSLKGRFDHTSAHEGESFLKDIPTPSRVIIDLRETVYISSVGLRVFLLFAKEKEFSSFASDRVVFLIPEHGSVVEEVLTVSHFDRVVPMTRSLDEARDFVLLPKPLPVSSKR